MQQFILYLVRQISHTTGPLEVSLKWKETQQFHFPGPSVQSSSVAHVVSLLCPRDPGISILRNISTVVCTYIPHKKYTIMFIAALLVTPSKPETI